MHDPVTPKIILFSLLFLSFFCLSGDREGPWKQREREESKYSAPYFNKQSLLRGLLWKRRNIPFSLSFQGRFCPSKTEDYCFLSLFSAFFSLPADREPPWKKREEESFLSILIILSTAPDDGTSRLWSAREREKQEREEKNINPDQGFHKQSLLRPFSQAELVKTSFHKQGLLSLFSKERKEMEKNRGGGSL